VKERPLVYNVVLYESKAGIQRREGSCLGERVSHTPSGEVRCSTVYSRQKMRRSAGGRIRDPCPALTKPPKDGIAPLPRLIQKVKSKEMEGNNSY